jgi:hypothetical protein
MDTSVVFWFGYAVLWGGLGSVRGVRSACGCGAASWLTCPLAMAGACRLGS